MRNATNDECNQYVIHCTCRRVHPCLSVGCTPPSISKQIKIVISRYFLRERMQNYVYIHSILHLRYMYFNIYIYLFIFTHFFVSVVYCSSAFLCALLFICAIAHATLKNTLCLTVYKEQITVKGNRNNKTFLQRLRCILWVITLHSTISYYKMRFYTRKTELEASTCQFPRKLRS